MNVIETSIRRPVTVIICTLAIIFFGLYVYTQMPQQKRPDTDFPIVTVTTTMSGANASVMDNDVADVLEEKLNGISGVNSISSSSYQGRSVTTIEFNMDKDINVAASDVRDKVSSAAGDLPDEADSPIVEKLDATSDAIVQIAITGNATEKEMSHYISKILKGIDVYNGSFNSLVWRLGTTLGKHFGDVKTGKASNVYVKAYWNKELLGDLDYSLNYENQHLGDTDNYGGSWWTVGFGANTQIGTKTNAYLDVAKNFGGDIARKWQFNVGLRWNWDKKETR